MIQRLFDVRAAADYLRGMGAHSVTVHFIRSIISRGEIPYVRLGKRFFLTRESIDRWLESHERRAR